MNALEALNGIVAVLGFLAIVYVFGRWFGFLVFHYRLTETGIRVRVFGLPLFHVPYKRIKSCEFISASRLWTPAKLFSFRSLWLNTRIFSDGVLLRANWKIYVLTPNNPEEFVKKVSERLKLSQEGE